MSNQIEPPQPQITCKDLMLATPGKLFSTRGWIYELKYDGFRCLVSKRGDVVRLESRGGRDMSAQFPELVSEIRPIPQDFVADGELVILDDQGRPQWDRLHTRHTLRHPRRIQESVTRNPAAIFAFDLLALNGADFRQRPLLERKAALHRTLPANRRIRYTRHLNDDCAPLWQMALNLELEGIVAKDGRSSYQAGRSTQWQKIKTSLAIERERERRGK
jgi:bifunctional non-homologous end joining protein LigD